jgi:hypothetical protein
MRPSELSRITPDLYRKCPARYARAKAEVDRRALKDLVLSSWKQEVGALDSI